MYEFILMGGGKVNGGYRPKYKECRTLFLKDGTQLANVMRVVSVCGEIGYYSIRLFGFVGKNERDVKYRNTRERMLEQCEYKSSSGEVLFKGEAFSLRGRGQEKTMRVTSGGRRLFEEFEWGKEYIDKFTNGSLPTDRERVLRTVALSEWCIFMLRSGIEFNPRLNPKLHNLSLPSSGPQNKNEWTPHEIDEPIFYPSKEIKRSNEGRRLYGRGSRAHGFLVKKDKVEICYRLPKTRMVWQEKEEGAITTFATAKFGPLNFGIRNSFEHPNALCLVDDYDKCEQVVFEPPYVNRRVKKEEYHRSSDKDLFKNLFSNVYVFPRNENGVKSFVFHNIPNIDDLLFEFYIAEESYREAIARSGYDCDAYNYDDKVATLFFFDGCITKLHKCAKARRRHSEEGVNLDTRIRVFCFPWQKEYIEKVFEGCVGVDIKTQNYEKIVEIMKRKNKERS
ncbi:MAG: hypothetical protein UGF89_06770 [Acutalibacteraceae bacterium]|nr:hypothetical protein [Acutalibacteraceae bacterium]